MIKFETIDGDKVWVAKDKIVLVTQAKERNAAAGAMPVLGVSIIDILGLAPLVVKRPPDEVALKIEIGGDGRSDFSAA